MKTIDKEREILWSLIKSLSKTEKRYFLKKSTVGFTDKSYPLYIKLFFWICNHDLPNDNTLLKELGPELTKKNLSYTRHYLQNQLMEALGQLEEKKKGQAHLVHNIPVIRRLFQQGQQTLAIRLWKQTLRGALRLEDYVILKLLKDEYLCFEMYYRKGDHPYDLLGINKDIFIDTEVYFQIARLEELCFQCILIRRKAHFDITPKMKKQLREIDSHPLLRNQPDPHPFSRFHFWFLAHGVICYLNADFENAMTYLSPLILQWQKRPDYIAYRSENYLETLYTYSYAAIHLKNFDEAEAAFHHVSNKSLTGLYNLSYFKVLKDLTLLKILHKKGDYNGVAKLLPQLRSALPELKNNYHSDIQKPLLISVAISHFVLDHFNEAEGFARQALLQFHDKFRPEQARVTHLLLLLICYEIKNEWTFQNQFQACYHFLYRNKSLSHFEKEFMTVLKKTFPYRKNDKNRSYLQTSLKKLNQNNTKIKNEICNIFNFPGWIDSRIQGISYRDWVQKQIDCSKGAQQ